MERFLNGLDAPIKWIMEIFPYTNMVELLHQAKSVERQVREDLAISKSNSFFAARNATDASASSKTTIDSP
jgi:hypothetical protein